MRGSGDSIALRGADAPAPEVAAKPKRRQFSAGYRLRILEEADRCTRPREIGRLLEVLLFETDLPLLAKLPLSRAPALAPAAVAAGAAGVVVGSPPLGAGVRPDGQTVSGELFGPGVFPMMLAALLEVKSLALPGSLIACGGVHTQKQACDCLHAGADALQLDSLVWVEPVAAVALAVGLGSG